MTDGAHPTQPGRLLRFGAPVLLSAFLLFQVQPMVAKAILAWFGGSPGVWTTCMLFFQSLLLAGYGYAHLLISRFAVRTQVRVHLALLALNVALLPLAIDPSWRPHDAGDPTMRILGLLAASVGLPYFSLAATGPLLQAWASRAFPSTAIYRLYALSNVGSLVALLAYPVTIEPHLTIGHQLVGWSAGYAAFALLAALAALRTLRCGSDGATPVAGVAAPVSPWRVAAWIALPSCASILLLAITNQLCQEVAVIPFLWLLPLVVYLASFIITFDSDRWYHRGVALAANVLATGGLLAATFFGSIMKLPLVIGAHVFYLLVACTSCHGELVRLRPGPERLTLFYLMVSLGGALGGVFVALVAPHLFLDFAELGIGTVACLTLCAASIIASDPGAARRVRWFWLAWGEITVAVAAAWAGWSYHTIHLTRVAERNFYGTLRVVARGEDGRPPALELIHGRTSHGAQFTVPGLEHEPTTYYGRHSGMAIALGALDPSRPHRIALLGLGVGTAAVYGRAGDDLRFFEIDPSVERIARSDFSFLRDSRARVEVVIGDARLSLEREPADRRFDAIVADVFSSDAIPAHLLTAEAFALYRERLADDGILAIHVSNRMLDLRPIVAAGAASIGLTPTFVTSDENLAERVNHSIWALLAREPEALAAAIARDPIAHVMAPAARTILWRDDYSNLFEILK